MGLCAGFNTEEALTSSVVISDFFECTLCVHSVSVVLKAENHFTTEFGYLSGRAFRVMKLKVTSEAFLPFTPGFSQVIPKPSLIP